jgi:hypothetical protein
LSQHTLAERQKNSLCDKLCFAERFEMDETAKINTVLKGLLSNMTILASIVADPSKLETIDSQTAVADAHTQFTSTVQYLHDMVTKCTFI